MASQNIFAQYAQPIRGVADYANDMDRRELLQLQLAGQQGQNALLQLTRQQQAQAAQQAMAERNALQRIAAQHAGNPDAYLTALDSSGMPGLMTQAAATRKARAEAEKLAADAVQSRASAASSTATAGRTTQQAQIEARRAAYAEAAALTTPEDAIARMNALVQEGKLPMQAVVGLTRMVQSDPLWKLKLMQGALDPDKLKEALMPHFTAAGGALVNTNPLAGPMGQGQPNAIPITQSADNRATQETSRANNSAQVAATMRGQTLADARARESLAQQRELAAGAVTYQQDADGNIVALPTRAAAGAVVRAQPVVGGPGLLPLQGKGSMTEDQGKATGWLVQADNAWKNMQAAVAAKPSAAKPGLPDIVAGIPSMGVGGAVGNMMRGDERQQFMQGASSLSEALLRAATGAGVNRDEAVQKVRELVPVFGDGDDVIAQKMASIPLYIESLKVRAGPGARKAAALAPPNPVKPNIDPAAIAAELARRGAK